MGRRFADSLKTGMDERAAGFDFTTWMDGIFRKMGAAFETVQSWYRNTNWAKTIESATSWQAGAAEGIAKFFGLDPRAASRLLTGRATGGVVQPGETTLVGERGPEIAHFPPGTRIVPAERTRAMLAQPQSVARGGQIVSIGQVNLYNQTNTRAFLREVAFELR